MKKILVTTLLGLLSFAIFAQIELGGTTNYTEVEEDGTIEFIGEATVWNDYVVPFTSVKTKLTKTPIWEPFIGTISQYAFQDVSESNEQEVGFVIQLPHDWDGTTIYPHIHWSPGDDGTGTERVVWGIEYSWVNYSPITHLDFPDPTVTDTAWSEKLSDNGHQHLITKFSPISPLPSSQDAISSLLVVRFYRNSSAAADDFSGYAFGLSFDIHYRTNTVGSRDEYDK